MSLIPMTWSNSSIILPVLSTHTLSTTLSTLAVTQLLPQKMVDVDAMGGVIVSFLLGKQEDPAAKEAFKLVRLFVDKKFEGSTWDLKDGMKAAVLTQELLEAHGDNLYLSDIFKVRRAGW